MISPRQREKEFQGKWQGWERAARATQGTLTTPMDGWMSLGPSGHHAKWPSLCHLAGVLQRKLSWGAGTSAQSLCDYSPGQGSKGEADMEESSLSSSPSQGRSNAEVLRHLHVAHEKARLCHIGSSKVVSVFQRNTREINGQVIKTSVPFPVLPPHLHHQQQQPPHTHSRSFP